MGMKLERFARIVGATKRLDEKVAQQAKDLSAMLASYELARDLKNEAKALAADLKMAVEKSQAYITELQDSHSRESRDQEAAEAEVKRLEDAVVYWQRSGFDSQVEYLKERNALIEEHATEVAQLKRSIEYLDEGRKGFNEAIRYNNDLHAREVYVLEQQAGRDAQEIARLKSELFGYQDESVIELNEQDSKILSLTADMEAYQEANEKQADLIKTLTARIRHLQVLLGDPTGQNLLDVNDLTDQLTDAQLQIVVLKQQIADRPERGADGRFVKRGGE